MVIRSLIPGQRQRGLRTVLVIDDSRASLHVIGGQLGAMGYLAVLAQTGREGLDLVAGRGIDLVLLDLEMPGLSGLEVLSQIRTTPDIGDLPVITMTALSDSDSAVAALNAGADDHLTKPFDAPLLHARLARTLDRAGRVAELKRHVAQLDARVAARAIELGEVRGELAMLRARLPRRPVRVSAACDLTAPDRPL